MSANGQEVEVVKAAGPASSDFAQIGTSGLVEFSGQISEEYVPQLQGSRAIATYKEMTTDPIVGGVLLAIDNLVRRVEWQFDPAPDSGTEGQRWADFAQTCIHDLNSSWADVVSSIFSMVTYGWSYLETTLKRRDGEKPDVPGAPPSSDFDDGLIGWRSLDLRSQDSLWRWEFGDQGSLRGMWQQVLSMSPAVLIPIEKALLFRTTAAKGSPEGKSVLRSAWRPWHFKRRIEEIEGIGIERDLAGMPTMGLPPSWLGSTATADQKAAVVGIKRMLSNVRRNSNEGVIVPREIDEHGNDLYKFELMTTGGRRQIDLDTVIGRKNHEIAICALADWLLLGHERVGAKALAESKIELFNAACDTWTRGVADVFNSHGTPRLMRANGVSSKLCPTLRPGTVQQDDIQAFAVSIADLFSSGALTPDLETENSVRQRMNLPAKPEPTTAEQAAAAAGLPAAAA